MTKPLTPEGRKTRAEAKRLAAQAQAFRDNPGHALRTFACAAELLAKQQAKQLEGMTETQRLKAKAAAEAKASVQALQAEFELFEANRKVGISPEPPGVSPTAKPLDLSQERVIDLEDLL